MSRSRSTSGITRLPEIWEAIERNAPLDEWVSIDRLYEIVQEQVTLRKADFDRAAPSSRQTKWQRNVRNVLQHRKTPGKTTPARILWDAPTRSYLIPRKPGTLPPSIDAVAEDLVTPDALPAPLPDPWDKLVLENLIDARRHEIRAIAIRRGGTVFRESLLRAYDRKCCVTNTSGAPGLEAAHIFPYRGEVTNHIANGLLLRADVHTLFDLGLVAVNPMTLQVEVAKELRGTDYSALDTRRLVRPSNPDHEPSQRSLLYHYQWSRVVA